MEIISKSKEINGFLEKQTSSGGITKLKTGCHLLIEESLIMNTPSQKLCGEVWAYNLDPNGVFETEFGTKLKLVGKEHPAIRIGDTRPPAGSIISDIGIQGDIVGMDTRGLFDPNKPFASAGLYFGSQRVDQGDFYKISCCGLASAVSIAENSEVDACDFRKVNTDGCCVGIYFSPYAAYYPHVVRCVFADNPSYGFYARTNPDNRKRIHSLDITDCQFVRNCGANHIEDINCAVYFNGLDRCVFRDNLVDSPGVFWYFKPEEKSNKNKTVITNKAAGLVIIGNQNKVTNNIFTKCSAEAISIKGDQNVLLSNIVDSDVIIEGKGNVVCNLIFTSEKARLILKGKAAETTSVTGVSENRILRI